MTWINSQKFLFRMIGLIFCLKVLLAILFPLTSDEGYYWLWSKHLAFSYVDHPPMIAWINWILTKIFWEPLIALRAGALIFNVLIAWIIFELSKELFGKKKSNEALHLRHVFLFLLIPNTLIIWLVLTVELPFVLFYLLAVLFFIKYLKTQKDQNLYLTGLWVGFGLLTKYTMILIYPVVLLFILFHKKYWYLFKKIEFWLSGLLGLAIFSPVLMMNLMQKSESFLFHINRIGSTPWFADTATFVAEQLVYLSPFLAYFVLRFYEDKKAKKYSHQHPEIMFASLAGFIPFIFFFLLSFKSHVWPHWPVLSYGIFVLLVGFWYSDKVRIFRLQRLMRGMIAFNLILLIVLLSVSPGIVKEQKNYWDNYRLASQISEFLKQHPQTLFASDYHGSVAQLAYYGKVNVLMPSGILGVSDGTWGKKQFERWQIENIVKGQDLVVLTNPGSPLYQKALLHFATVELISDWQLHVMEGHLHGKKFYWCKGFGLKQTKI